MNKCIVNEQGELIEILQIEQKKEPEENQFLVTLSNYYEILNKERYLSAVWNFKQEKWIGQGEKQPSLQQTPNELEILQTKLNAATQQLEFQEELIVELAMRVYE